MAQIRLLVVDDDADIRELLSAYLARYDMDVETAADGASLFDKLEHARFDLIILDIMLPGEDGLSLCRRLRSTSSIPVIFLTALDSATDRVVGLELGADDYVVKPFDPRELLARLHAILRRREPVDPPGAPSKEDEVVRFGNFSLDLGTRKLSKGDEEIPLTTGEFAVLKTFARHPRVPLSRDKLMEMARGREYEAFDRSLDVQVSRLRKIIEPDPSKPRYLQTVWGLGYVFIPDGASDAQDKK